MDNWETLLFKLQLLSCTPVSCHVLRLLYVTALKTHSPLAGCPGGVSLLYLLSLDGCPQGIGTTMPHAHHHISRRTESWQSLWHYYSCRLSPNKLQIYKLVDFSTQLHVFQFLYPFYLSLQPQDITNWSMKLASPPSMQLRAFLLNLFLILEKQRTNADQCWEWWLLVATAVCFSTVSATVIYNVRNSPHSCLWNLLVNDSWQQIFPEQMFIPTKKITAHYFVRKQFIYVS